MSEATQHYDTDYFDGHYGALIRDEGYYQLMSLFWRTAIFEPLGPFGVTPEAKVLDYGCGTGVLSAALPSAAGFDVAPFVNDFLAARGRSVFSEASAIPRGAFDVLLCSHSLEHHEEPRTSLLSFKELVRPGGHLILILPIDDDYRPTITPDSNQHLYCWNFQSITNLLLHTGWSPRTARILHHPFLLKTLGKRMPSGMAVPLALTLGKLKRSFPSMLVLARNGLS